MSAHPILEAKNLYKSFLHQGRTIDVLSGVNLRIEAAERLAIVGQSGAGKSTLLHVLGTLDEPTSGEIQYAGQDILARSAKKIADFRNQFIGFIFQFHHLLAEFTAVENVMMPRLISRVPKAKAESEAKDWLNAVGLSHRLTHRPGELSGGEQQRVALARALVNQPRLLMADEPTGNLDGQTSAEIHALFDRINAEHGTAMLVVTHDRDFAAQMPRQLEMRDGVLIAEGEA